jgi:ribokinase
MVDAAPIFVLGSFVAACSAKVARLPIAGESLLASHFVLEPGGKGFNLAVGARRLNLDVDGLLAVGTDLFADFAKSALRRAELPLGMLVQHDGPSGAGIGFIQEDGENCLAVYPGANAKLSAVEVMQATGRITGAKLVLAQFEIADEPIERAFALARQAGGATLLNPSPYRAIRPAILAKTSILVVNRVEAQSLALQYDLETEHAEGLNQLARTLFAQGLEALIVTLGAEGAWLRESRSDPYWQPPFKVAAMDTLGAGDAFIAGFAAAFAEDLGLRHCMRWGAAAGAIATTRPGVFEALPSRAQLEKMLEHDCLTSITL